MYTSLQLSNLPIPGGWIGGGGAGAMDAGGGGGGGPPLISIVGGGPTIKFITTNITRLEISKKIYRNTDILVKTSKL